MAEIKKYVCDVKGCKQQLGEGYGSPVRVEVKSLTHKDGNNYPAVFSGDLCGQHLGEIADWIEGRGLNLELQI